MGNVIKVGMADLKIGANDEIITTLGLGSCVGIALYDPLKKIGGLAHIMLPDSTQIKNNENIAKFADTGIAELLRQLIAAGASKTRLVAKLAGGAKMFQMSSATTLGTVGERNVDVSRLYLKKNGIRIIAEDVGLNYGRTVELHCETGEFYIKSVGKDLKII